MQPWEIASALGSGDPDTILSGLAPTDAFWIGASYAIDPFVGIIYRLPLADPRVYGGGAPARVFDKLAKAMLDGNLTGDSLAMAVETFSKYCGEDEWVRWYRPILQGALDLRLPLAIFNKHCPDNCRIPPPALNKPTPLRSMSELPRRFFLQPVYPEDRVFWLVNSKSDPIEIRGYDAEIRQYHNQRIADMLLSFAQANLLDIVLTGFAGREFLIEDVLKRDEFTRESGISPLHKRLYALGRLALPMVQRSGEIKPTDSLLFHKELNLIFEQGYQGAVARDLDGYYPFRAQRDRLILPVTKGIGTVKEVIPGVGFHAECIRGKKQATGIVRLGLTQSLLKDISGTQGKRFDMVFCKITDNELVLPVFKNWRDS